MQLWMVIVYAAIALPVLALLVVCMAALMFGGGSSGYQPDDPMCDGEPPRYV